MTKTLVFRGHQILKTLSLLVSGVLFLSACASMPGASQGMQFNAVELVNLTESDIYNMQVEVTSLHRKFMCGVVLHRSTCRNGFSKRSWQENEIAITWEQRGQQYSVGPFEPQFSTGYLPEQVYVVQFILMPNHQLKINLQPVAR